MHKSLASILNAPEFAVISHLTSPVRLTQRSSEALVNPPTARSRIAKALRDHWPSRGAAQSPCGIRDRAEESKGMRLYKDFAKKHDRITDRPCEGITESQTAQKRNKANFDCPKVFCKGLTGPHNVLS
jgi:hypothetical protein